MKIVPHTPDSIHIFSNRYPMVLVSWLFFQKLKFKKNTFTRKSKYIILWTGVACFLFFLQKWQHSKYDVDLFT